MSQHYPHPDDVDPSADAPRWPSRMVKRVIERDGQIVPLLVRVIDGRFVAADRHQSERLLAIRELEWPTILVETSWTDDDL